METQDIALTALHPIQMQESQATLIAWCDRKIAAVHNDWKELDAAWEHAKAHKWQTAVLKKHANLAERRYQYFVKIREALLEGYYIVPNFPIQLFVVKKKRGRPRYQGNNNPRYINSETADELPLGTGEYQNPQVTIQENKKWDDNYKKLPSYFVASEFADIEFPLNMAKPTIMEATSKAMGKRIFDQLGVLPSFRKGQDPMIIGQIIGHNKIVSFMVAWHLNTAVL